MFKLELCKLGSAILLFVSFQLLLSLCEISFCEEDSKFFFGQMTLNHLSELTSTDLKLEIGSVPLGYLNCA